MMQRFSMVVRPGRVRGSALLRVLGQATVVATLLATALGCRDPAVSEPSREVALRIGVLFDTSGPLGDFGRTGEDGARLAAEHIDAAGGVLGGPVDLRFGDSRTEVDVAVREARRLVDVDGVHALIGPLGSAAAESVVVAVSAPSRIPTLSPTATAPGLSLLADDGYFFRGTVSDAAQAPILANLARDLGARHAAVFFQDDTYGRGLSAAFAAAFEGMTTLVPVEDGMTDFSTALDAAAGAGADLLVAMTYVPSAVLYLGEALDRDLFAHIALVDATASVDLVDALGAERLEGIGGTAPTGSVPGLDAGRSSEAARFDIAFEARYGRAPVSGLEAAAYDLVVAVALAAAHAGATDGESVRDALPVVTGGGGERFAPGEDSVAKALAAAARGEAIDYEGASSSLEWDAVGDLATGSISLWTFRGGEIVETGNVAFDARGRSADDHSDAASDAVQR